MNTKKNPDERVPCGDCESCIPIGDGNGLCDFSEETYAKFFVSIYDVCPNCPKVKVKMRKARKRK